MKRLLAAMLPGILAASISVSAGEQGAAGKLILDESAYWRYYVRFGPDRIDPGALQAEGEKLLGPAGMKRLRTRVKRYLGPPYVTAAEAGKFKDADWRDHARVWFATGQGDNERAAMNCHWPAPPEDWAQPQAAAGRWPRQRMPLMVGNALRPSNMHGDKDMQQLGVRAAYFRTTFDVADPARAGGYVLTLRVRGGARVLVNGQEIARKFLPTGALDAGALAKPYPKDAYLVRQDETPAKTWQWENRKVGVAFCEDLPGRFDDAFADATPQSKRQYWSSVGRSNFAGYFGGWTRINRDGFERITKLRNRTIGPVTIPAKLLRRGANVLAIEVRAAGIHPVALTGHGGNWGRAFQRVMFWSHCRLLSADLRCASPQAGSALDRPAGVQVWAEDMHRRCYGQDFGAGGGAGTVRLVGAANGTYSGQVVVGSDRRLTGLKVTPTALKRRGGGGQIPASALRAGVMVAHPASELVKLGQIRNTVSDRSDPLCPPAEQAIIRFGPAGARAKRPARAERLKIAGQLRFFDHIGPPAGGDVPAGSCRPIWLWLTVPPDAAPGVYTGQVKVEADGMKPVVVPVEADVLAWRLPDAKDFQTVVALEQSPYGVAAHYKVPPWSDRHFKLLEASFEQLARVGNDLIFVPCLQNTEFGNFADTPIRWIRRQDGSLTFDYSALDRYLALARKHLGGGAGPRVICFVVMHGVDRFGPGARLTNTVAVVHEGTGKVETLDLSPKAADYRASWKAFATSLHAHMAGLGLAGAMHWGFCWDNVGDPLLPPLLSALVPEVGWARSGHTGRAVGMFRFACSSLSFGLTETSRAGWKARRLDLLCPRSGSSTLSSNGHSPPLTFRLLPGRALVAGASGIGRLGADYWADIFFRGYAGSLSGGIAGMPCSALLWPGADGAEPSGRFEALREGLQEAEARIYLEQAIDRKLIQGPLAARAARVLSDHHRQTLYVPPGRIGVQIHEYAAGWQQRSRRLYAMAGEVARGVPMDVDRMRIDVDLPARAKAPVTLALRNWTRAPRAWTASADRKWLVPARASGKADGHQTLDLLIDTGALTPAGRASGQVIVTDVAAGRAMPVRIDVRVGKVFDLVMPAFDVLGAPGHAAAWDPKRIADQAVFNLAPGGSDAGEYALLNTSGSPLAWKIASSAVWLKAEPASGRLGPGERTFVKVAAAPPDQAAARREAVLTVSEAGGATLKRKIIAHVIPPYRPPAAPGGEAVWLKDVPKTRIKSHKSIAYWCGTSSRRRADYGPKFGPNHQVRPDGQRAGANDMHAATEQVTVYAIAGAAFEAFSAKVRVNPSYRRGTREGHHRVRVSFEVHADGRLLAQSGLMTAADEPRLIVATGLAGAKEITFVTRFDRPNAHNLTRRVYCTWIEPKFHKPK